MCRGNVGILEIIYFFVAVDVLMYRIIKSELMGLYVFWYVFIVLIIEDASWFKFLQKQNSRCY